MLLPIITVPYLVRIIGPEKLGLLSFSQAYIAYFAMVINFGFELSAIRSIAANRDNHANTERVVSEVLAGKTLLFGLCTIAFVLVTWAIPEFRVHLGLHICTFLMCIGTVLFPLWLFQAMEDLGQVAIFNLVVRVLFAASIFIFIHKADDYVYQNLALSLAQVVVGTVALSVALKRFRISLNWPSNFRLKVRFREDSHLFFSSLMITLYAGSSVFILGLMSDDYSVGIFSAGTRLEGIARSFVGVALNQAFFPVVAAAFGRGREEGLRLIRMAFLPLFLGLLLISAALWIIAPTFIGIFYGAKFADAALVFRIVVLLTLTIGLSNLLGYHTMLNLHMDRAFFAITAFGSVLGITLNIILIGKYQHFGAAYAWVITEIFIAAAMYSYLRSRGIKLFAGDLSELRDLIRWRNLQRFVRSS